MKKNIIFVFVRNLVIMIIGFLVSLIIARSLGPELQGKYTLLLLIPTIIFNLGNLGLGSSIIYLVNREPQKTYTYLMFTLKVLIGLAIINGILGGIISYIYFEMSSISITKAELAIIIIMIPILFANNFFLFILQALKRFDKYSVYSILPRIIQLMILLAIIIFFQNHLMLSLISLLIPNTIIFFIGITELIKIIKNTDRSKERINAREYFMYGLKTHAANTITFINYRVDQLLLGYFLNSYYVGIYNIAIIIVEKVWSLTNPIITVLYPEMSSIKDSSARRNITCRITRLISAVNIIIGIMCFLTIKPFILFAFGTVYKDSINITNILIIGILCMSIDKILSNDFASIGKPEINLKITNVTFISNLILAVILIPLLGITGAAMSTTISYVLTTIMKINTYKKYYRISIKDILIINAADIKFLYKKLNIKNI